MGPAGKYFIDKIGAPAFGALARNLMSTERGDAQRLLLRALESSGMTPQDAAAELNRMGPDAVLADLSPALRQLGIDTTSIPGSSARNIAESTLIPRARQQQDVIWNEINQTIGGPPGKKASLEAIERSQKEAAGPLYDEAYGEAIQPTQDLLNMLEVDDVKKAYKAGRRLRQLESGAPVESFALVEGQWKDFPNMQEWDYIQRGLRSRAEANRIKNPTVARAIYQARNDMLEQLDEVNPAFGEARRTYAQHEALKDAMDAGERFLKEDEELLGEFVRGLTDSERQAYMVGVAKTLRREIMGAGQNRDISKLKLFNSPLNQEKLTAVLGPQRAQRVLDMAENLGQQQITANRTLNRSPTADILAGQKRMGPRSVGDFVSGALDTAFGNPELSIRNADSLANMLYGQPSAAAMQPTLGGLLQLPPNIGEVTPSIYGLLGAQTYESMLGDNR
jgi:hypothetical protein